MIDPVDDVSDIVQIARDLRQLRIALGKAHRDQDVVRGLRDLADMRKAVLGVAQSDQRLVRFADVGLDGFVSFDFIKCNHRSPILSRPWNRSKNSRRAAYRHTSHKEKDPFSEKT